MISDELKNAVFDMSKELSCSICLSVVSDPARLPCSHYFCWSCIQQCLSLSKPVCPTCKATTKKRNVGRDDHLARIVHLYGQLEAALGQTVALSQLPALDDILLDRQLGTRGQPDALAADAQPSTSAPAQREEEKGKSVGVGKSRKAAAGPAKQVQEKAPARRGRPKLHGSVPEAENVPPKPDHAAAENRSGAASQEADLAMQISARNRAGKRPIQEEDGMVFGALEEDEDFAAGPPRRRLKRGASRGPETLARAKRQSGAAADVPGKSGVEFTEVEEAAKLGTETAQNKKAGGTSGKSNADRSNVKQGGKQAVPLATEVTNLPLQHSLGAGKRASGDERPQTGRGQPVSGVGNCLGEVADVAMRPEQGSRISDVADALVVNSQVSWLPPLPSPQPFQRPNSSGGQLFQWLEDCSTVAATTVSAQQHTPSGSVAQTDHQPTPPSIAFLAPHPPLLHAQARSDHTLPPSLHAEERATDASPEIHQVGEPHAVTNEELRSTTLLGNRIEHCKVDAAKGLGPAVMDTSAHIQGQGTGHQNMNDARATEQAEVDKNVTAAVASKGLNDAEIVKKHNNGKQKAKESKGAPVRKSGSRSGASIVAASSRQAGARSADLGLMGDSAPIVNVEPGNHGEAVAGRRDAASGNHEEAKLGGTGYGSREAGSGSCREAGPGSHEEAKRIGPAEAGHGSREAGSGSRKEAGHGNHDEGIPGIREESMSGSRRFSVRNLPWPCSLCTYENAATERKCIMCGTVKLNSKSESSTPHVAPTSGTAITEPRSRSGVGGDDRSRPKSRGPSRMAEKTAPRSGSQLPDASDVPGAKEAKVVPESAIRSMRRFSDHDLQPLKTPLVPAVEASKPRSGARASQSVVARSCSFCQQEILSSQIIDAYGSGSGELLLLKGNRRNQQYVHRVCATWAPCVFQDPQGPHGFGGIHEETARAKRMICSICCQPGAALSCTAPGCNKTYHFPCAASTAEIRLDKQQLQLWCDVHANARNGNEDTSMPASGGEEGAQKVSGASAQEASRKVSSSSGLESARKVSGSSATGSGRVSGEIAPGLQAMTDKRLSGPGTGTSGKRRSGSLSTGGSTDPASALLPASHTQRENSKRSRTEAKSGASVRSPMPGNDLPEPQGDGQVVREHPSLNGAGPQGQWKGPRGKWVFVGSGLDATAKAQMRALANMAGAKVSDAWDPATTHVVCACDARRLSKRTMKYMLGVLAGCWLLDQQWVADCLAARDAVSEEAYEVSGDQSGNLGGPKAGRLRLASNEAPVLAGMNIHISGACLKKEDMITLVRSSGGSYVSRLPLNALSTNIPHAKSLSQKPNPKGGLTPQGSQLGRSRVSGASDESLEGPLIVLVDMGANSGTSAKAMMAEGEAVGAQVLSVKWLMDCAGSGRRMDFGSYSVGGGSQEDK